jgi:hypothetical protein
MIKKDKSKIYKTLFFSSILLLVFFASIINVAGEKTSFIQVYYDFENPIVSTLQINGIIYDNIMIDNSYIAGNPGEPSIPSKGAFILIPPNSAVKDVKVEAYNKIKLGNNFNIQPLGEVLPISKSSLINELKKDEDIYQKNDFYPGDLFSNIGVYSFRGYDILVLLLNPIQYNPVSGEIFYYENFKVTIETIHKDGNELFRGTRKDKVELFNKIDNPEIADMYVIDEKLKSASFDSYELLILTTDSLKSGFEPLKTAHDAHGLPTVIKTLTDVGSSDPEDIRNYIRDAYNNWGVNYVLIGGDHNIIPARILWVYGLDEETTPYETYMPSDLYYSCLDGTYNYDGDNKWGEPTDGEGGGDVDLMAEVHVGRACVDNIADVNNFVTKTVAYINKNPEDEYLNNVCLAGEYMGDYGIASYGGAYMDQLEDGSTDDGYTTVGIPSNIYTITKLYDSPSYSWGYSEIMAIINNGVHIINHLGHSGYDYNLKMYSSDVYYLTNNKPCFIYSQGCMAGGFDDPWGYDCIAEDFTVKTSQGAFAGIWNARYGWFWSYSTDGDSQRFHRQFWNAVFGENIPEIGRANSRSKENNLPIIGRSCIRWCYYQLNLFGDPSLNFFETSENNPPDTPIINGPSTGIPGVTYEYEFTIYDSDEDTLYLKIEWSDGTSEDWIGPLENGVYGVGHSWGEKGKYIIKAKVRDTYGAESDWGLLDVQIPRNRNIVNTIFYRLLQRFPNLIQILSFYIANI